jgi:hypothetical protein
MQPSMYNFVHCALQYIEMQTCIHSAFKDQKRKYHRGQKKDTVRIAQIDTVEILVNVQPKHFGYRINRWWMDLL